jgi:plasmid stability protein
MIGKLNVARCYEGGKMAKKMAKKAKISGETRPGRGSDQFMVRLPAGMRTRIADMAARHGKSMNAEVVTALAIHIAGNGEPDVNTVKSLLAKLTEEIQALKKEAFGRALGDALRDKEPGR